MPKLTNSTENRRWRFRINGIVQGVGFRPFVYRIAHESQLNGFVKNDSSGVTVEVEGAQNNFEIFKQSLASNLPHLARIDSQKIESIQIINDTSFEIISSDNHDKASTLISPDIGLCDDCLGELFDPTDRRFQYPFINCTNCGPRYTIVKNIPYDRLKTSMNIFPMCEDCLNEYTDPTNRRFHAQPNACFECGPRVSIYKNRNKFDCDNPIDEAVKLLKDGKIGAVKGIGGFHLVVNAMDEPAVQLLRERKHRFEKPLALMMPDIKTVRKYCLISAEEEKMISHHTRPIVLLKKNKLSNKIANSTVYDNQYFGVMLPYTPLHYLLLRNNFEALVMTSGNLSEEPIAIENLEAIDRLDKIADFFLLHDREILQRCDDSIVRIASNEKRLIRRARGFVPDPVYVSAKPSKNIIACGAELKSCIALTSENKIFLSQHIGDLDNPAAMQFFEESISHLKKLMEIEPDIIACDLHPEYLSTKWAHAQKLPVIEIQHHHAHLASVLAENKMTDPAIGIILDGTGYGLDQTIWGGEILVGNAQKIERFGWLEQHPMPGGTASIKEPWRMALSYLVRAFGEDLKRLKLPMLSNLSKMQIKTVLQMIAKKINCPMTSSCGRLFDGVSALINICHEAHYEAQPAISLEMAAGSEFDSLPPGLFDPDIIVTTVNELSIDEIIKRIVHKVQQGESLSHIAAWFHVNLAELFIMTSIKARDYFGINNVALSGGVYQNQLFFEYIVDRLGQESFNVLTHKNIPANDGGIALGQAVIAGEILQN